LSSAVHVWGSDFSANDSFLSARLKEGAEKVRRETKTPQRLKPHYE
jgi:hypothetical protein